MFKAAARRACASVPKPAQLHQLSTRSIANTTRPTIFRTNYRTLNPLVSRNALLQIRHLSFSQRMKLGFREASKGIWRKNPVLLPIAFISTIGAALFFAYVAYIEITRVAPQYHKFPPPVAETLRTAVYYTEVDLNPPKALQAYKEALRIGNEMGLHPFSDEVLGIKLQVAMMLEKAGLVKPAIEVLERTKVETLKWIDEGRMNKNLHSKETATDVDSKKTGKQDNIIIEDPEILDIQKRTRELEEFEDRQRDKALKKSVGIQMKLAELYSSDYIQDDKKAESAQVAAVELCLKEMRRRQTLGLPVGGASQDDNSDAWLNLTEIATALTDLATTYSIQEKHELAMPLYLRALDLLRMDEGNNPSCKQVTLLNDVASAMFGQLQKPVRQTQQQQQQRPVSREQTIDAAKQWAQKAIDVAARIEPPIRDDECDIACITALYNLGELAEIQNKRQEAIKFQREAKSLATGIGFEEGIAVTDSALKRLTKKQK